MSSSPLYGALGVAQATQNALNIAWAVPRNRRPNPIMARLRSVLLLAVAGLAILLTTFIANVGAGIAALGGNLETSLSWLLTLGTMIVNGGIFTLLFWLAAAHRHSVLKDVPGGLFVAAIWQVLQYSGTAYVSSIVKDSSATAGVFAVVLGMMAWIYLGALAVIFAIEINVVLGKRLYPRALLTPFTDNVDLTDADRAVYTGYAQAQGHKGFQSVDVTFDDSFRRRRGKEIVQEELEAPDREPAEPEPPVMPPELGTPRSGADRSGAERLAGGPRCPILIGPHSEDRHDHHRHPATEGALGHHPQRSPDLGNYLGALRRFVDGEGAQDGFFFVADLHALTSRVDPGRARELTLQTAALFIASGLDPGVSTVFVQSHVRAHVELSYLLECTAYVGELSRMIQFKEKGGRPRTRASLFTYPCLMAADILLYDARRVPVGGDQSQHVELARDLALRFNRDYGETFVVPGLAAPRSPRGSPTSQTRRSR